MVRQPGGVPAIFTATNPTNRSKPVYRCELCRKVSQPNQPRKTHALLRPNKQIYRELAVCNSCDAALKDGVPVNQLRRRALVVNEAATQVEAVRQQKASNHRQKSREREEKSVNTQTLELPTPVLESRREREEAREREDREAAARKPKLGKPVENKPPPFLKKPKEQ